MGRDRGELSYGSLSICFHSTEAEAESIDSYVPARTGNVVVPRQGLILRKNVLVSLDTVNNEVGTTERQGRLARRSLTTVISLDPARVDIVRHNMGPPGLTAFIDVTGTLKISTSSLLRSIIRRTARNVDGRLTTSVVGLPTGREDQVVGTVQTLAR